MTIRDRLIHMLEKSGSKLLASRSTKYLVYSTNHEEHFYLGKSGSFRMGRTISTSHPVPLIKANLLRRYALLTERLKQKSED